MYTHTNFKSKKALKEAVAAGQRVTVYQPGPFGGSEPKSGKITLEGPSLPRASPLVCRGVARKRNGCQSQVAG